MGKSSPPAAPDPVATASAQTASNVSTAAANAALNNQNQYSPYGSTTYQQTGSYTTPSGETVPQYSQYTQLSPLGQTIFTGEQGISADLLGGAQGLTPGAIAAASKPLDFNTPFSGSIQNWTKAGQALDTPLTSTIQGAPAAIANLQTPYDSTLNQGPQLLSDKTSDALYRKQATFLDPQWKQQGQLLQDQLSRQGIPVGSQAYNNAMDELNRSKTQAYQTASDSALAGGTQAAGNLFGMALAGKGQALGQQGQVLDAALSGQGLSNAQQQQAFGQALSGQQQQLGQQQLAQSNPLQMLQALTGSAPPTQSQPLVSPTQSQVSPTDVIGATGLSSNAANQNYAAKTAQSNATFGGLASLGGAAALAIAL